MVRRVRFTVRGQVQGVGFRPFVFCLAEEHALTGFVRNSPRGVVIETQGAAEALEAFSQALERRLPPLARITSLEKEECSVLPGERVFAIARSTAGRSHHVLVSPDIATCPDCLADIAEPGNRRFAYPFANCTNCGPRYSIIRSIPYDRAGTSMACFPLCPDCLAEYENPRDRRFHAQPNACPACGPEVTLLVKGRGGIGGDAAMRGLAALLLEGRIAAIKGLGGFHLACDACDARAVDRLRERKHRPHKPFAVMAADVEEAERMARVGKEEREPLLSPERPIVLCPQRRGVLAPGISPDTRAVGVMLPYTPLHTVLFRHLRELADPGRPLVLVMTSGNPGGEPICLGNREAMSKLEGMADAFLLHNRDILIRVDDSVVRPLPGRGPVFFRRARGYVPRPTILPPLPFPEEENSCILGMGADLKNTLCLTKGGNAFVSQHIGDMGNLETAAFHEEIHTHLASLLQVQPRVVVRDLHPGYLSSRLAEAWAKENRVPALALQHHYAHAHAVLAENGFSGRALVLALDGTGLGEDGDLWGGELLYVDCGPETLKKHKRPVHERLASFAPMDLPGGEAAIREPWRIAHALLLRLGLLSGKAGSPSLPWLPEYAATAKLLPAILERRVNSPVSTSCGRLFDAVAALLGLCNATSYEGQAAIRLDEAQGADAAHKPLYPCPAVSSQDSLLLRLDTHVLFAAVYDDWVKGEAVSAIARCFHQSLLRGLLDIVRAAAAEKQIRHVGLSGGSLQNVTLANGLAAGLEHLGLHPLTHSLLPPNDACISLGQAAWARYVTE